MNNRILICSLLRIQKKKNCTSEGSISFLVSQPLSQIMTEYYTSKGMSQSNLTRLFHSFPPRIWNRVANIISPSCSCTPDSFLNHISLLYYYGLLNALRNMKLDEKNSAEDVMKLTKNIYKVDTGDNGDSRVSAIQKKTRELLQTINVDLLR